MGKPRDLDNVSVPKAGGNQRGHNSRNRDNSSQNKGDRSNGNASRNNRDHDSSSSDRSKQNNHQGSSNNSNSNQKSNRDANDNRNSANSNGNSQNGNQHNSGSNTAGNHSAGNTNSSGHNFHIPDGNNAIIRNANQAGGDIGKQNSNSKNGNNRNDDSADDAHLGKNGQGGKDDSSLNPLKNMTNAAKDAVNSGINEGLGQQNNNQNGDSGQLPNPKNSPIGRMASKMGKKALKNTAKVAAPAAAGLMAAGVLYFKMRRAFGMMMQTAAAGLRNAIDNSALGHMVDLAHNAVAGIGNIAGQAGNALGNLGNAIGHGASALGHLASNAISTVTTTAIHGVQALAHGIGVSTVHAASLVGVAIAMGAGGIIVLGIGTTFFNAGQRDTLVKNPNECLAGVDAAQSGAQNEHIDKQSKEYENAKELYKTFKVFGLNDTQIAGILGNWGHESGIDPTSVESIFDEPYEIGPRKKAALSNPAKYVAGISHGNAQYTRGGACPGIGLGQWTGGNGVRLMAAAKKVGAKWYDLKFQVAYMIANDTPTGKSSKSFWDGMKHTNSVNAAVQYFLTNWEGVTGNALQDRESKAATYYRQMKDWDRGDKNDKFVQSVFEMAKQLGKSATAKAVTDAAESCAAAEMSSDNSTAANAALSYAWDNQQQATGNNGTKLYQQLHRAILPGDPYFESCDRNVSLAMRWSGTDINYPAGPVTTQRQYLAGSHKWKKVGTTSNFPYKDLRPGDVMVSGEHTYLYVGAEAIRASIRRGEHSASKVTKGADDVDASYGERSAGIGAEADYSINKHGDGPYDIYRCIKPDHSSKYKSVAAKAKN